MFNDFKNTLKTKKAIKKGIKNQIEGRGYSFIEVLSTCPTNWGMKPQEAADWVKDTMVPYYPLGNFRDN
jgi:2-oxoglutarate ferredoxin oxidoreductase subunit beta